MSLNTASMINTNTSGIGCPPGMKWPHRVNIDVNLTAIPTETIWIFSYGNDKYKNHSKNSSCPPVSSTDKTDPHDITEILLKVVLNTIKQTNKHLAMALSVILRWNDLTVLILMSIWQLFPRKQFEYFRMVMTNIKTILKNYTSIVFATFWLKYYWKWC
jgi:hypothetical protein